MTCLGGPGFGRQPATFPDICVHVQRNNVPGMLDVRVRDVLVLLHCDWLSGLFERAGSG